MKQNRFKSKVAWVTTGAAIVTVLSAFGVIDAGQGNALNGAIVAIAGALTVFGIFNDPNTKDKF